MTPVIITSSSQRPSNQHWLTTADHITFYHWPMIFFRCPPLTHHLFTTECKCKPASNQVAKGKGAKGVAGVVVVVVVKSGESESGACACVRCGVVRVQVVTGRRGVRRGSVCNRWWPITYTSTIDSTLPNDINHSGSLTYPSTDPSPTDHPIQTDQHDHHWTWPSSSIPSTPSPYYPRPTPQHYLSLDTLLLFYIINTHALMRHYGCTHTYHYYYYCLLLYKAFTLPRRHTPLRSLSYYAYIAL